MGEVMEAFYLPDGDGFVATGLAGGPWDPGWQHGGPPSALLGGAMARLCPDSLLARVVVSLERPVPVGRVDIGAEVVRSGRSVSHLAARLTVDGRVLVRATGLAVHRRDDAEPSPLACEPWPEPETLSDYTLPFFRREVGYHRAVDLRVARGRWGDTPVGFWARSRVPLVAGRALLPIEHVLILADAESGLGPPLDPDTWSFVNPDLVLHVARTPGSGWLGFDIHSMTGPDGAGWSASEIRDDDGPFGRSAQALVVRPRS